MFQIAALQVAHRPGEGLEDRFERVLEDAEREAQQADLVVLPELWWTGYFNFDTYERDAISTDDPRIGRLAAVAERHAAVLVAGTFLERGPDGLANCAVVLGTDGELIHTYRKVHLFGYESREAELLTPGRDIDGVATPVGTLAATTCYDLRFPELYRVLVERGVEVIVIPAAWPAARRSHWRSLLPARAIENQAVVVACNGAGTQAGVELAGHSAIIDPLGETIAEAGEGEEIIRGAYDLAALRQLREDFPVLRHRRLAIGSEPKHGPDGGG